MRDKIPLEHKILAILKSKREVFSIPLILKKLEETVTYQAVRKALEKLEAKGDVVKLEDPGSSEVGYIFRQPLLDEWLTVDFDVEENAQRTGKEKEDKLILTMIKTLTKDVETPELKRLFIETAKSISSEDPRKLYFRFAEWLYAEHKKTIEEYKKATATGLSDLKLRALNHIRRLEDVAYTIFFRQLGIPRKKDTGPYRLAFDEKRENDSIFKPTEVEKGLEKAIFGKYFIEKVPFEAVERRIFEAGTDASVYTITPGAFLPTRFEKLPVAIIVAVATRYDLYDKKLIDIDARPEPKTWITYTTKEAQEKGLVIPPEAALQLDDIMWKRTKEAAMNLRQYNKDLEALAWSSEGKLPDIVFRDGRIFPLEHHFADYYQGRIHGMMVRAALFAFANLVAALGFSERTLICGVVKRPAVEVIAPVVFWYMKYGSRVNGHAIWEDMEDDRIFRYRMSDQQIALELIRSLDGGKNSNEAWVTCRLLRRFSSMAEPELANENSTNEHTWIKMLEEHLRDRDPPVRPDVDLYAQLCAKAAVVTFYASTTAFGNTDPELNIPRFEILVPPWSINDPKILADRELYFVKRLLTSISDPRTLDVYVDKFIGEGRRFLLPKPVCLAHEYAKDTGKLYEESFLGYLLKWAIKILREKEKSQLYS